MILWQMASPIPIPPDFVVKKGSKIRFRLPDGIPDPLSEKLVLYHEEATSVLITNSPSGSQASFAFLIKLKKTCFNREASAWIFGESSASSCVILILTEPVSA